MKHLRVLLLAALLVPAATGRAAAVCTPFLCYIDLGAGGTPVCPNAAVFTVLRRDPVTNTPANPTCPAASYQAVVAQVNVPVGCTGVSVWVQYDAVPQGFTLDLGDSQTDDGFGGDGGSLPAGQNAELQVLNNNLTIYSASSIAADVVPLATQTLALQNGALNVVAKDQFVSWGEPYSAISTPVTQQLFFLPANPTSPDNRTLYVGLNRVIDPTNGTDTIRNGCGARRAMLVIQ